MSAACTQSIRIGVRPRPLAAVLAVLAGLGTGVPVPSPAQDDPMPVRDRYWALTFARQKRALEEKPADVCFVGDSLTHCWESEGKPVWDLEFHQWHAVNFGIGGDRTEHILYRLAHTALERAQPRTLLLLAGTNNLSRSTPDPPEAAASGVRAIVSLLRRRCPGSAIVLLTIPPNGTDPEAPLRRRITETNRLLTKLDSLTGVTVVDIHADFVDATGRWLPGMTSDGTHLTFAGYDRLGRRLGPILLKLLENESSADQAEQGPPADGSAEAR